MRTVSEVAYEEMRAIGAQVARERDRMREERNDAERERDRCRRALVRIAELEDEYRDAGLPYDLDTGAQMASGRAGDIAREGLGLPARESAYDPPLGRSKT